MAAKMARLASRPPFGVPEVGSLSAPRDRLARGSDKPQYLGVSARVIRIPQTGGAKASCRSSRRALALFDPLLARTALVVERDQVDPTVVPNVRCERGAASASCITPVWEPSEESSPNSRTMRRR